MKKRPFISDLTLVLSLSVVFATPAVAWVAQRAGAPYLGVGDVITYTVYYGLRAYSNAVAHAGTQPLMRIRETGANQLCDVLPAKNGGLGLTSNCSGAGAGQTVSAFCGGVDCTVHTLYDQLNSNACASSTTCNVVQTTNANQPTLSAADSYQVMIATGSTAIKLVSANNYTNGAVPLTMSVVAQKIGQFDVSFLAVQGNQGAINGVSTAANTWRLIGTSLNQSLTAADSAWHTDSALIAGATSSGMCLTTSCGVFNTTSTIPTTAGKPQIISLGNASAVEKWREAGWATNHTLTAAEASAINLNTSTYWGFTPP